MNPDVDAMGAALEFTGSKGGTKMHTLYSVSQIHTLNFNGKNRKSVI